MTYWSTWLGWKIEPWSKSCLYEQTEKHKGIGKTCLLDVLLSLSLHVNPTIPVSAITGPRIEIFTNVGGKTQRYRVGHHVEPDMFLLELISVGVAKRSELLVLHNVKAAKSLFD